MSFIYILFIYIYIDVVWVCYRVKWCLLFTPLCSYNNTQFRILYPEQFLCIYFMLCVRTYWLKSFSITIRYDIIFKRLTSKFYNNTLADMLSLLNVAMICCARILLMRTHNWVNQIYSLHVTYKLTIVWPIIKWCPRVSHIRQSVLCKIMAIGGNNRNMLTYLPNALICERRFVKELIRTKLYVTMRFTLLISKSYFLLHVRCWGGSREVCSPSLTLITK